MKHLAALVLFLVAALGADAATIHVDGTTCSLGDAIVAANTDTPTGGCPMGDAGADTIVLDADVTLVAVDPRSTAYDGVGSGLPDVTDDLTITAGLGDVIRRDPTFTCDATTVDPVFRFLNLEAGSLVLDGLTLADGCFVATGSSADGGGIRGAASTALTLDGVTVRDFGVFTPAGHLEGGFLRMDGDRLEILGGAFEGVVVEVAESLQGGVVELVGGADLSIVGTSFSDIDVSTGSSLQGGILYTRGFGRLSGARMEGLSSRSDSSLQGGVVYASTPGSLIVDNTEFRQLAITGAFAASVQGGALYGSTDVQVVDSSFVDLTVFGGSGCSGGAIYSTRDMTLTGVVVERTHCASDGAARGAAAYLSGDASVVTDCVFRDNETRSVTSGRGGAVYSNGFEILERCAFVDNRLRPAFSFVDSSASGGAVYARRIGRLRNVTFAGNLAEGGSGVSAGRDGASALGGGLYLANSASSSIAAATFVDNRVVAGEGADGFLDGQALGGGLYVETGHSVDVLASILTDNAAIDAAGVAIDQECVSDGALASLGHNLVEHPDASCGFDAFADVTGLDPELYPVDDYGCVAPLPDGSCVPTAAIDQSSWAIDWGTCAEAGIGDDARGLARRQDIVGVTNLAADACDTGAFEARDTDGDGITDVADLCPGASDPDQADADGDRVGDACDQCAGDDASGDTDGDLVCDDSDRCAGFADGADADHDGVPDGCDLCFGDDATGDGDSDLVCDDADRCVGFDDAVDGDEDGVPDGCDLCLGDDASGDRDGDGVCDSLDASLGDRVWLDDGNGIQDGGEPGVGSVTVRLFASDGTLVESTSTDGDGAYAFSPGPGAYYVEIVLPVDMAFAPRDRGSDEAFDSDVNAGSGTTSLVTLVEGQLETRLDAGLEPAVIGNRVWYDINADGRQQPAEPGLADVVVRLLDADADDRQVATTATDGDGRYAFVGIGTGTYRVEVVAPAGAAFSDRDRGADDLVDSDVDPESGRTDAFAYASGSASRSWDAGVRFPTLFQDGFETGGLEAWASSVP